MTTPGAGPIASPGETSTVFYGRYTHAVDSFCAPLYPSFDLLLCPTCVLLSPVRPPLPLLLCALSAPLGTTPLLKSRQITHSKAYLWKFDSYSSFFSSGSSTPVHINSPPQSTYSCKDFRFFTLTDPGFFKNRDFGFFKFKELRFLKFTDPGFFKFIDLHPNWLDSTSSSNHLVSSQKRSFFEEPRSSH